MSLVSDADIISFLGIQSDYFIINSGCNNLNFKYDAGATTATTVADGSYTGAELATLIKSALDTAFTITSTVSWSSSTRKFTLTVSAGHTLQYIHSGSDLGTIIGFTANTTASLSITSDTACGDPTANAIVIRNATESIIAKYCRRILESTSYTLEKYDGTGTSYLYLKAYPITSLSRLSIGTEDGITIANTNNNSSASVSVNSTGVVLEVDGTENSTCTFAGNTTLTLMVAAINAVGSGWSASVSSTDFASYKSTLLLKRFGANCNDSNTVYLQIPYEAEDEFEVNDNTGEIFLNSGFPSGKGNIYITYTGGYTSSSIPSDLSYAIKVATQSAYDKYTNASFGLERYTIGDLEMWYSKTNFQLPNEAKEILSKYKRVLV